MPVEFKVYFTEYRSIWHIPANLTFGGREKTFGGAKSFKGRQKAFFTFLEK